MCSGMWPGNTDTSTQMGGGGGGGGGGGVLGFHPMDMVMRHPELPDGLVIGRTGYFGGVALPHYPAPS